MLTKLWVGERNTYIFERRNFGLSFPKGPMTQKRLSLRFMAVEMCWVLVGNSKRPGGMCAARKRLSAALKGDIARQSCSEIWRWGSSLSC